MDDDEYSGMFKVDKSEQFKGTEMVLFNQNTKIIGEGQKHKVIYGEMELQKKPLFQIVSPYLQKFAASTADLAAKAGSTTFQALKVGFWWVYNKFIDDVVPYAIENLPQVLFVTKKKKQKEEGDVCSGTFQVIGVQQKQYENIQKSVREGNKKRVVIPLGTQNDAHFEQFLKNEKYQISYQFPIDEDSEQQYLVNESFMIPSQSYEVICQDVQESHAQLQLPMPNAFKKKAYKLQNCFIFQLEGQNTIEYDMLDSIVKSKETTVGYLVFPEQELKRSRSVKEEKLDPIGQLVQGVEQQTQTIILEQEPAQVYKETQVRKEIQVPKVVDNERKVRVEIAKKKRQQLEVLLN